MFQRIEMHCANHSLLTLTRTMSDVQTRAWKQLQVYEFMIIIQTFKCDNRFGEKMPEPSISRRIWAHQYPLKRHGHDFTYNITICWSRWTQIWLWNIWITKIFYFWLFWYKSINIITCNLFCTIFWRYYSLDFSLAVFFFVTLNLHSLQI